ncbi:uncharacterized protein LOC129766736 [Toxorhynchites rutilus septentrionalis]|uniref:uncharacterized protein LOC129766736 n=1 Tax=Toxorhynchites rutilus septentrionalis TaxID=329112 RepID=UPI0024788527|nr:uncharacterized protein LOC129766736 [Toxorhynchites rutilus septentrionalis]
MATELKKLEKRERFLRDSLNNLEHLVQTYQEDRDIYMLEGWRERLEGIFSEFMDARLQLECSDEFQARLKESFDASALDQTQQVEGEIDPMCIEHVNQDSRAEFELIYLRIKGFITNKLRSHGTNPSPAVQSIPAHTSTARVKLPEIKLPLFDGSIKEWPSFRDTFLSLIDSNPMLSQVDKFSYLVASLCKDAKRVIDVIEITADNYSVAWDLLDRRYDNKYLLVKSYVEALFAIDGMKRECAESLNRLIDDFERNLKMLQKAGENPENWSTMLVFMMSSRLDQTTLRLWETHRKSTNVPTYTELVEFLRSHGLVLQSLAGSRSRAQDFSRSSPSQRINYQAPKLTTNHSAIVPKSSCPFCKKPAHSPYQCEHFRKLTPIQRFDEAKSKKLCINCLGSSSHIANNCSGRTCRVCHQKHHTMLHHPSAPMNTNKSIQSEPSSSSSSSSAGSQHESSSVPNNQLQSVQSTQQGQPIANPKPTVTAPSTSHFSSPTNQICRLVPATVLLSTALVKVYDSTTNFVWARALLDSGSELNFVSERLVQTLQLKRTREFIPISGVGLSSTTSKYSTIIRVQSQRADFEDHWKFHVLSKITMQLPNKLVDINDFTLPSDATLADPSFNKPGRIDLILGVQVFYELLRDGQIKIGADGPILQNTALGWVVSGKVKDEKQRTAVANVANVVLEASIENLLTRFWETESCHIKSTQSLEEKECEDHFAKTVKRDSSGRFVVALPKKDALVSQLGNSRDIADCRFCSLERRLNSNPQLKEAYSAFIHEYVNLGHMKLVDDDASTNSLVPTYYLPHHCVVRPDSITTKLRVVFDASCPTDSGISLNDALLVGPVVQDDLLSILLRFRIPQFAITADIEKMYRQILVQESDQPLQRIRWRDTPSEPIKSYQLTTVTYGTSAAPYLATKCLQKLSEDNTTTYPLASVAVGRDFYMDDLLTGADTVEEGRQLCRELLDLTNSAGFSLRKWTSNNPENLTDVPDQLKDERTLLKIDASTSPIKTLGLQWDIVADEFRFEAPTHSDQLPITKRIVYSDIARLFDPLGLVGPVVVQAKLLLQRLWYENYDWDIGLPEALQHQWMKFRESLQNLTNLSVPRWAKAISRPINLEIHGFSDASERAYGACIYVRAMSSDGEIKTNLLIAKSKIAPKGKNKKNGTVCLPRLELCATLLLSHLFEKVEKSIKLQTKNFFWTDSEICLHWFASNPSRWKTFVANRCSEIQQITAGGIWSHVPGSENPADVISRGMTSAQLQQFSTWWNGPTWLSQTSRFWPSLGRQTEKKFGSDELEERTVVLTAHITPSNELFSKYSSFMKLVRVVAWLLRYCHNASSTKENKKRRIGCLSTMEINTATQVVVKLAQMERFANDIAELHRCKQVKSNSRLKALFPILVDGILRVGGRLRHAPVSYNQRHPIILPDKHPLTNLIMIHYHHKLLHAGPQLMIAVVRERFWPLRIRNIARRVVHSCVSCFRCKPKVLEQLMGELPQERVTPTFPFLRTGVDYCGPFYFRPAKRAAAVKCYVAVFVCLVRKALHLEFVTDLTSDAFIAALKRFVSRRGIPELIECDNGLNFQGAQRQLEELARLFRSQHHQKLVARHFEDDNITFKFIPPRSPNFGGLWEAAVKSLKKHLRCTLGNVILYHDEFVTLLTQIESCLNSRPLTQLSSDPNDLEVLTPGHFLVHRSLKAIPEPSMDGVSFNRLNRWQQTQEYVRKIWKQWQSEYLSGLQPRTRWTVERDNIKIGTMVLLKEDNQPPLKWKVGRITEIFKGNDNHIRVVTVRTSQGEYRRSISKICVLPVQQSDHPDSTEAAGLQGGN